jgi:hypothetical protein
MDPRGSAFQLARLSGPPGNGANVPKYVFDAFMGKLAGVNMTVEARHFLNALEASVQGRGPVSPETVIERALQNRPNPAALSTGMD